MKQRRKQLGQWLLRMCNGSYEIQIKELIISVA